MIHISDRNDANQLPPDRESNKQVPAAARLSEGVIPLLPPRMADIAANDQRLVEENVFGFLRRNLMAIPILWAIRFVPIETSAVVQRVFTFRHKAQYTIDIYKNVNPFGLPVPADRLPLVIENAEIGCEFLIVAIGRVPRPAPLSARVAYRRAGSNGGTESLAAG